MDDTGPCPRRVGIQHPLKPAGVAMFDANLCDVQAQQLAEARQVVLDLIQLAHEQSGQALPFEQQFIDWLTCDGGDHDPRCPISLAKAWLERTK